MAILNSVISLEEDTGKLYWRSRDISLFKTERSGKTWNSRFSGKEAMCLLEPDGYKSGTLFGRKYMAHRIVWALASGSWPTNEIDHVNGDRSDNRPANLRHVTCRENRRNQKGNTRNVSGCIGVSWCKSRKFWLVQVGRKHVGTFQSYDDAVEARRKAQINEGYHKLHGSNPSLRIVPGSTREDWLTAVDEIARL